MKRQLLHLLLAATILCAAKLRAEQVETVPVSLPFGEVFEPYDVAVDPSSNRYYLTDQNSRVISYDPETGITAVLATGFLDPRGIILARGGLVVCDAGNNQIKFVSFGGSVTVLAGTGTAGSLDGAGAIAQFRAPSGLAVDSAGVIYIADQGNNRIRTLDLADVVSTLDLPTTLRRPSDVAIGGDDLYIADTLNGVIKLYDGSTVRTVASLQDPRGLLMVGGATGLVMSDSQMHIVTANTFFAGKIGSSGSDDGPGNAATFNGPIGLGIDVENAIIVADQAGYRLRRIRREKPSPLLMPSFSLPAGEYNNPIDLRITSGVSSPVYRYTVNGDDPTFRSASTTSAISLDGTTTLKVVMFSPDYAPTDVIVSNYNFFVDIPNIAVTPQLTNNNDITVSFSSTTRNAEYYYTLDGSDPVKTAIKTNGVAWDGTPVTVSGSGDVRVRAFRPGYADSAVRSARVLLTNATPVVSPTGAEATNDVEVTLSSATGDARILWTIDGTDPVPGVAEEAGPDGTITVNRTGALKVRAVKDGYVDSLIVTNFFILTVAKPAMAPAGGTFNNPIDVVFSSATKSNITYHWTTDATDPTRESAATTNSISLVRSGVLKVRAFRDGYVGSTIISNTFIFKVAKPTISAAVTSSDNTIEVTLDSITDGDRLFWTIDGTDPTEQSTLYTGPFQLGTDGVLKVRGFREGFEASDVASQTFDLKVSTPVITPAGVVSDNAVEVEITTATSDDEIYWTIDGTEPTRDSTLYSGKFLLEQTGEFQAKAFRNGFVASDVAKATFTLKVATPAILPQGPTTNIYSVNVTLTNATEQAELRWTIDGSDPTPSSPLVVSNSITVGSVGELKVKGFRDGFEESDVAQLSFQIQVDAPVFTVRAPFPGGLVITDVAGGYFPDGILASLSVLNTNAAIHYRLDGGVPTTNDLKFAAGTSVELNQFNFLGRDLRSFTARAFADGVQASEVARGAIVEQNQIGIPRDMMAGIGSRILVPIVLQLKEGERLQSMQFRVHVSPTSAAVPNLTSHLDGHGFSGEIDFVRFSTPQTRDDGSFSAEWTVYSVDGLDGIKTNVLEVLYTGENSNLDTEDGGVSLIVSVPIPPSAKEGDTYSIQIAHPSATSDGRQKALEMVAGPARTIQVRTERYVVGDSAGGAWFNAGDFGDGDLNNNDVNNAFAASLGIRSPYPFSDVFDAMDAFPIDSAGVAGGDGQIRFLDWQQVFLRSIRHESINWERFWNGEGQREAAGVTLPAAPNTPAEESIEVNGTVWARQATVRAVSRESIQPGAIVEVPVELRVADGASISGLQFLAEVEPMDGAPALDARAQFVPAAGVAAPRSLFGLLDKHEVACGWSVGAFEPALSGAAKILGHVRFQVPDSAPIGASYQVRFRGVDGSPDFTTQYDMESLPGLVWIGTTALRPASETSTEWRVTFFGQETATLASDDSDPDADGVPNWREYALGTDPAELRIHPLQARDGSIGLRWFANVNRRFVLERSSNLTQWEQVGEIIVGDGTLKDYTDPAGIAEGQFYRVRAIDTK